MNKVFVKDQDQDSHTLEIIDKYSRYNGQPLFQVHNQEFFGAVEDAWNSSTSIKANLQHAKQMLVREAFRSLFLIDTLKTVYTMRNSFHRSTKSEYFFKNQGIFFSFVFKKTGRTLLCYLRCIVTQEIHTIH